MRTFNNCGFLSVPMYPWKEQEAIAEALSDADALIEGLERLIAKKRLIKQGAMQDLLTAKRRLPGFSGEWVERKLGELRHVLPGSGFASNRGLILWAICPVRYGELLHGTTMATRQFHGHTESPKLRVR